ncbi:MAG: CoA-binding protein [Planctomycetes bacterium]|nr:CoA-binding protein [Planctomycetota bacterium]
MPASTESFLAEKRFAVVGASADRSKYGNKVLRCYAQHGRDVVPVHPKESTVEGRPAFASLTSIPGGVGAVSVITPPAVTEKVVEEAAKLGIKHVWMQPGAESDAAVRRARELGMNVIAGGPCLLVVLGFSDQVADEDDRPRGRLPI